MTVSIQYAYLKQQTWLFRRNYPKQLQPVLGLAYKQSLKTGDARVAKARAAEANAKFEEIVTSAKAGGVVDRPTVVAIAAPQFSAVTIIGRVKTSELAEQYLNCRSDELRQGGFKSVRFGIGLFVSVLGARAIGAIGREDALAFTRKVAGLGCHVGKSCKTKGYGLERLLAVSEGPTISPQTQGRIVRQVSQFLDWAVYEGQLAANPFKTVRVEAKAKAVHYEVLTDPEVQRLLALEDVKIGDALTMCLLTGLRPNSVRQLKTDAAERVVPLHSGLTAMLARLPATGRLFPGLSVNMVTKQFAKLRVKAGVNRPGVVFHSSRKWFVTQCERAGVPEHWTASIVGHQSARSENRMTYRIYSAGISDEQKRDIVEKVGLPTRD